MNELLQKLGELVEQCGNLSQLFIKAETAMKNGDLAETQKFTRQGQGLLGVMVGDVFEEAVEAFETETEEFADIADIDTLEITKHLCEINSKCGVLLGLVCDNANDMVTGEVKLSIVKEINSVKRLYMALFAN